MTFEELKTNQKEVLRILKNSFQKNRLVHSYIFEGEKGVGKLLMATYLAMMLLCKSDRKPCFECTDCHKVLNHSHLNVYFIEPEGESIKKNQIEDLIYEFSMTSLESGCRIYIINEADKMNAAAANSLLKFLEEPRGENYAILITEKPQFILDTIKSRSQIISFKPINRESSISYLIKKGVNEKIAFILSNITSNVDQALELINSGEILDIIEMVEKLNKAKYSNQDIYATFFTSSGFLFENNDKDIHRLFIDVMELYEQGKLKFINHADNIYLDGFFKELGLTAKETNQKIIDRLSIYIKYQERLNYNVNLDLLYSSLFLEI